MNLLWIGTPKISACDRIFATHFVISHTFQVLKYDPKTSDFTPVEIPDLSNSAYSMSKYDLLVKLPYLLDIWSRWDIGSVLSWDQLSQKSVKLVSRFTHIIASLNIHQVVATYSAPHHFWNNLVELACELLEIPVLHIYPFLELDIAIPVLGNNHNLRSFPRVDEPNSEWSRYASSKISIYVERLLNIAFSPETQRGFNPLYSNSFFVNFSRSLRVFKSFLSSFIKQSKPYNPLSFAGLLTPPLTSLTSLSHIQENQNSAIAFYLKNISSSTSLYQRRQSPTFILIGHLQPEATTAPLGGDFYSQIKVVEYLRSRCKDCRILYKEHPGSFYSLLPGCVETLVGVSRSVFYYKELLSLGVELISATGNVISLLKEYPHLIPVTITGSVAIEAPISVGSPCIYFGKYYWFGYPGSLYYKNVDWSNIQDQFSV